MSLRYYSRYAYVYSSYVLVSSSNPINSVVLWALEKRGFSYRAISLSNILIRPTHFLGTSEFLPPKENRPIRYVSELLGENK